MIDKDVLFEFQQRWAALDRHQKDLDHHQKDLDYQRMLWAKDLRAKFKGGAVGDKQFMLCCVELLKIEGGEGEAKNLLVQANISSVVKDEKTFKILGGPSKLKVLCTLPKKDQVAVAEIAKRETLSIGSAVTQYEIKQGKREAPPPRISNLEWNIRFAKYIRRTGTNIPDDIEIGLKLFT